METPSFIFGGSTGLSYEELQRRRKVLDALSARGNGAPQNVGEGIYSLAQGLTEGLEGRMLRGQQAKADAAGSALGAAGLSAVTAPYTMASATAPGATVNPTVADPTMGGIQAPGATVGGGGTAEMPSGEIYGSFMDTVKQGGLNNPYGLAAVAATGKAESGFDPGNVYRQWSDPSQSGQAGNAGGIMSWRAERLENMRNFAAKNGGDPNRPSPQLQAQFFLNEDPSLVAKLNAAKSPEEAQTLMNNAWKFAGYDNPNGGEAARRIATARSYAQNFAGQSQPATPAAPQQVASLDPAAGMDLTTAVAPPGAAQAAPAQPANVPMPTGRAAVQQAMQAQPQAAPQQAPSPAVQRVAQAMPQPPQPPSGQIPPEALRALADPSVPESQKQAIQIGLRQRQQGEANLYDRQMAIYNQQVQQIQMQQKQAYDEQVRQQGYQREDQRFGVTDAREAARLDLERQRFEREGNKRQIIDVYDETTGRNRKGYMDESGAFVPVGGVEAPKDANGISFTGPDGTQIQIGGSNGGMPKLTEAQSKDVNFYTRIQDPAKKLDEIGANLTSLQGYGADSAGVLGNYFLTPEYQQASQAAREFLTPILRKDTGAAITDGEMEYYGRLYLPRPGDGAEVIQQKQQARARAVEGLRMGLGTPAEVVDFTMKRGKYAPSSPSAQVEKPATAMPAPDTTPREGGVPVGGATGLQPGAVVNGHRYKGGNPNDRKSWEPVS